MMGDIQQYFIDQRRPQLLLASRSAATTSPRPGRTRSRQLAFTLANGFTYRRVLPLARDGRSTTSRPTCRFFFSNGMDPEYARDRPRGAAHLGQGDARALRRRRALPDAQVPHPDVGPVSLHAQEIDFNDIRTTLQALYAIFDNCNTLHTNAYDEAITTPTEESVRRAMAIQLIINHELGLQQEREPAAGLVHHRGADRPRRGGRLAEFDRISERGGVLGAMETMYQRGKIQDESLYYETLKHDGDAARSSASTPSCRPTVAAGPLDEAQLMRSTDEEKRNQIDGRQGLLDPPCGSPRTRAGAPAGGGARTRQRVRGADGGRQGRVAG